MDIHALIGIASDLRTCGENLSADHCSHCDYQDIRIGCSNQMKIDAASTIEMLAKKLIEAEDALSFLRKKSMATIETWPEVIREPLTQFHVSQQQDIFSSRFHSIAPGDPVWCIERDGDFGPTVISRYLFVAGNTRCVVTSILPDTYNGNIADYLIDVTKTGFADNCGYFDDSDMGMTIKVFPLKDTFATKEAALKEKARREIECAEEEKARKRVERAVNRITRVTPSVVPDAGDSHEEVHTAESVSAVKIPGPPKKKRRPTAAVIKDFE